MKRALGMKWFNLALLALLVTLACAPAAAPAPAPAPAAPKAPAAPAAPAPAAAPAAPAPTPTVRAAAPAPAAPAKDTPRRGGILNVNSTLEAPHFDPMFLNSVSLSQRAEPIYSHLMRYKSGDDVEYGETILEPDLAERWEISKDGMTYTFYLRKGVKWQNIPPVNGRELTADDILFSLNRIWKTPGSGQANWFTAVQSIEALDKYTVKINMKVPSATFLTLMGHGFAYIHAKEVVDKEGSPIRTPIGTGPFMLGKRQVDVKTELLRNPDYFLPGIPYLDVVNVFYITDQSAALAALRASQLDVLGLDNRADIESVQQTRPDMVLAQKYLALNFCKFHYATDQPPFNDDKLRKAVSLTLDRDAEIKTIYGGNGEYIMILPLGFKGWSLPLEELGEGGKYWKKDLKLARQLLTEGGYPIPFEVPFLHNLLFDARLARYVSDLNESGLFKLKSRPMTREEYLVGAYVGKFPPGYNFTMGCGTVGLEPGQMLNAIYHPSQTVSNNSRVNDPVATKMMEEQDTIMDPELRRKKIQEIQRYLATKMYYAPMTQGFSYLYRQPYIKNFRVNASYNDGDPYKYVWIAK